MFKIIPYDSEIEEFLDNAFGRSFSLDTDNTETEVEQYNGETSTRSGHEYQL